MKKLTITVDEDVYEGLHAHVGAGRISRFVNDLVRPLVSDAALEEDYAAMAGDGVREAEAEAWTEGLIADVDA